MKLDAYMKMQDQLDKIQLKLEIFNIAQTYYAENDDEEAIIEEEMRQYMETDYTKMFEYY